MEEQVKDVEAEKLAKEMGALFSKTSAMSSAGIDEMFLNIGKIFVDPSSVGGMTKEEMIQKTEKLKAKGNAQKKKCC